MSAPEETIPHLGTLANMKQVWSLLRGLLDAGRAECEMRYVDAVNEYHHYDLYGGEAMSEDDIEMTTI